MEGSGLLVLGLADRVLRYMLDDPRQLIDTPFSING